MVFDAEKLFSQDEWNALLQEHLGYNSDEYVELGSIDFKSCPELIINFFEQWVGKIDHKIAIALLLTTERYDEWYRRLIDERGFTYLEFLSLFDDLISETDYHHYPAYEFLQITHQEQRRLLINKYKPDVESYIDLIENSVWGGADFFLKRLKSQVSLSSIKRHCYVSGKSGSGKSNLLLSIFYHIQKMSAKKQNSSLVLIDPHGDLAEEARGLVLNKYNSNRLIYIDPTWSPSLIPVINPLEIKDKSDLAIERTSQMLVAVFEELVGDAGLTMYMSSLLFPCIATLLRKDGASLADLQTFMNDEQNTKLVNFALANNPNPTHQKFFRNAFYNPIYEKTKAAIYTRIHSLLNTQLFRDMVIGKSTIDIEDAIAIRLLRFIKKVKKPHIMGV